jgi:hypothetical protein
MIPSEAAIRAFLPLPVKKSGSHLICTCWNCKDQNHYYFNLVNGLSDCKKCGKTANLYQFLQGWGRLDLLEGNTINYREDIKLLGNTIEEELLEQHLRDFRLPVGFRKLDWNSKNKYVEYLKSRKYTEEDFQFYQPGSTQLIERYEDYVLIPIGFDYSTKGLLARYIGKDETKLRYQNSKGTKFGNLLDGYDQINSNTHTLIITEGHFDKVSVTTELELNTSEDWKAISTFGKKISDNQISLLQKTNVKNLFLMYDQDAVSEIKQYGTKLNKYFKVSGCFNTGSKDPGNMNKKEILQSLDSAKSISRYIYTMVQGNCLK